MSPSKQTVLVVDDMPANIDTLVGILRELYQVKAATSGPKALEIARGAQAPDIILLDIMMPDMDGYEVCRQLKGSQKTRKIPVIFVTCLDDADDETKGLELGAVDYLSKPVTPAIVRARVANHLALRSAQAKVEQMLSTTLRGSLLMLGEAMAWGNSTAYLRASRVSKLAVSMARKLGLTPVWHYEMAGQFSQIGCLAIPEETLLQLYMGMDRKVTSREQSLYRDHPILGAELIGAVDLLKPIANLVLNQNKPYSPDKDGESPPEQILRTALHYDTLVLRGASAELAVETLKDASDSYPLNVVEALDAARQVTEVKNVCYLHPESLLTGMVLDEDVFSITGLTLAIKGTEINAAVLGILRRFAERGMLTGKLRVLTRDHARGESSRNCGCAPDVNPGQGADSVA